MLPYTLTVGLALALLLPIPLRAEDAPKIDKDLEGDWRPVSSLVDGRPTRVSVTMLTIRGDVATFVFKDESYTAMLKTDATKTPRNMNFTPDKGPQKGKTNLGIYEIKEDVLSICLADLGEDRPTELSTKEGTQWMLMTFDRARK